MSTAQDSDRLVGTRAQSATQACASCTPYFHHIHVMTRHIQWIDVLPSPFRLRCSPSIANRRCRPHSWYHHAAVVSPPRISRITTARVTFASSDSVVGDRLYTPRLRSRHASTSDDNDTALGTVSSIACACSLDLLCFIARISLLVLAVSLLSLLCLLALLLISLPAVLGGRDFYKILGIERRANERQIKKAYRQMSKLYHPGQCTVHG
jgi:hypothetical protein